MPPNWEDRELEIKQAENTVGRVNEAVSKTADSL